jgi:hypothetical protein
MGEYRLLPALIALRTRQREEYWRIRGGWKILHHFSEILTIK